MTLAIDDLVNDGKREREGGRGGRERYFIVIAVAILSY